MPIKEKLRDKFTDFRYSLAYFDALPQLIILGLLIGLVTAGIIMVFRVIVDLALLSSLADHTENFEALDLATRLLFIVGGIVLLIVLMQLVSAKDREVSVSHVLDRLHNHQAKLPMKNWWVQFFGAIICLVSGQSVGKEGPVAHLGAGAASHFGQWLRLPNNSIHTMIGCGVAAAISASFNTPMAGVIFAMEVLALQYTIAGFLPVITASVVGTIVSKAVFSETSFIVVGDTSLGGLYELPAVLLVGLVVALCAAVYIRLNISMYRWHHIPVAARLAVAGLLTALAVIWVPEVMGQGYDTVNKALDGQLMLTSLALIAAIKLLLTPVVIGLGIPGGLIGPMLVIGACAGGAIGQVMSWLVPDLATHAGFFVIMGMAAMMAAALNAPLAALVTVLELTYNPNMIFPAMLVIVVACVMTRQIFGLKGIFIEQLEHTGRALDFGPAQQILRQAGVRSVMDTRFVISEHRLSAAQAKALLKKRPMWLVLVNEDGRYAGAMRAADLANHLDSLQENEDQDLIDLYDIPGRRFMLSAINESCSLYEAMQSLSAETHAVLYISGPPNQYAGEIKGILTRAAIENYYRPREFRHHDVD